MRLSDALSKERIINGLNSVTKFRTHARLAGTIGFAAILSWMFLWIWEQMEQTGIFRFVTGLILLQRPCPTISPLRLQESIVSLLILTMICFVIFTSDNEGQFFPSVVSAMSISDNVTSLKPALAVGRDLLGGSFTLQARPCVSIGQLPLEIHQSTRKVGGINETSQEEKKKKEEKILSDENSKGPERPKSDANSRRNRGHHSTIPEIDNLDYDEDLFAQMTRVFDAGLANTTRVKMLIYCLKERSFTDIMLALRLNPASLKHHQDLLRTTGLVRRTGRGKGTRYKTTDLGRILLRLMATVQKVIKKDSL